MIARRAIAAGILLLVGACAHSKIANTTIDDTEENREILELIESYHRAIESRDAEAVLAMVSKRYFEDNGNTDRSDDYDYSQLAQTLPADFERTKAMQLEIRVDEIVVEEELAHAFIFYTVRGHADFPVGSKWKTTTDRARLTFTREGEDWKIISGL